MPVPGATVPAWLVPRSHVLRTWSDAQLTAAVADSSNWRNVMRNLGLNASSAGAIRIVRRDVERLGLDLSHLESPAGNLVGGAEAKPDLRYLRDAATSLAAAWFSLCGFSVAIPTEPAVYDLLVVMPTGI